jgi:glycosyltransferase involved in cell wall biosynthesis
MMPRTMNKKKKHILIAGTYSPNDAYPNIRYKVECIKSFEGVVVTEVNFPLSTRLNYQKGIGRYLDLIRLAASLLLKGLAVAKHVIHNHKADVLYIPYPAVPLLWLLGWVPRSFRPRRIVADIFISLYETVVLDRGLLKRESIPARLLRHIERSSYRNADLLLTDTPENSEYFAALFDCDPTFFHDIPLAINEALFSPAGDAAPRGEKFRVVFAGTLVPLQGIERLCEAIASLPPTLPMEFIVVGDGQQAPLLESFLVRWKPSDPSGVEIRWQREWLNSAELAGVIRSADLCIGILGHGGKASRVWPLKNYLYMACGKPLATTNGLVAQRLSGQRDSAPFLAVDCSTPEALVQLLKNAPERQQELRSMGKAARRYYEQHLSQQATRHQLAHLLAGDE